MPFRKVTVEEVKQVGPDDEDIPPGAKADSVGGIRVLSDKLDTEGLSINHYELEPGESFTVSTHRHGVQEELFYVVSGTATFESESQETTVASGEIIRIPPGMFQLGTNYGDEPVMGLALGAPREYEEDTEWLIHCEECSQQAIHIFSEAEEVGEYRYECTNCDSETYRVS